MNLKQSIAWLIFNLSGLLAFSIICLSAAFAQTNTDPTKSTQDTAYVTSYADRWTITTSLGWRYNMMEYKHPDNPNSELEFESIFPLNLGFSLDYKWISLGYGFNIPVDDKHTTYSGFRFSITKPKIWTKISWQSVNGYSNRTLENMRHMSTDSPDLSGKRQFNPEYDTKSQTVYFNILYAFNPSKYSHLASLWQINKQKKSAGTFAVGLVGWYNSMTGDSVISPYNENYLSDSTGLSANPSKDVSSHWVAGLGLQFGYAYTLVIYRDYFVHLSTFPAFMIQRNDLTHTNELVRSYKAVVGFMDETQFSTGYNGTRWFAGIRAQNIVGVNNLNVGGFEVHNSVQFSVFFGVRM